jgi:hypothetical protein
MQPSTSTDSESSSSSSPLEGSQITIRPKRIRGVRSLALCPPEQSTPTPAVHHARVALEKRRAQASSIPVRQGDVTPQQTRPLMYCPGVPLRLQTAGYKGRTLSESLVRSSSESPAGSSSIDGSLPRLIRKKSGQLVKPSLKSSKSRDSLTVLTRSSSSKSEPNTPTHAKNVHFDSKLEHVKLFLAEQKPLAVSRDGSPTEDTSGTDNDFPPFIFGDSDAMQPGKRLVMHVPNMPTNVDLNADVALEELTLSPDRTCILGRVRLRNITYAKWLAVRFTFDNWQTTSEVTGKYVESVDNDFDRFSFSIRLNDLLARIEGKTLYMALRYTTAGREFWDNNGGNNYLAVFTKVAPSTTSVSSNDKNPAGSAIADLRSKLEKVALGEQKTSPSPLARSSSDLGFPATASFAARYDFGTSLKEPWKPVDFTSPPTPRHIRTQSHPATTTPNSARPANVKTRGIGIITSLPVLGSPREIDDEALFSGPRIETDLEESPFPVPPVRHHRRGYFDDTAMVAELRVRRTSQDTPRIHSFDDLTPVSKFHPFPSVQNPRSSPFEMGSTPESASSDSTSGADEQSTPSLGSPASSSRSSTPSPTDNLLMHSLFGTNGDVDPQASPNTNYHQFLTR